MNTSSTLDRVADQLIDDAAGATDLVADALADVAHSAVDVIVEGGESLAALSLGAVFRRLRQPRSLVTVLVLALVGAWLYRRFTGDGGSSDGSR